MFKRLLWLTVGVGFGFGMSFWVVRAIRQKAARWSPDQVGTEVARAVRGLGRDLRAAASEGADAMRAREAELRHQIGTPTPSS